MFHLLVLFAFLMPGQQASIPCSNPGHAETQALRGPDQLRVAVKISSADDHAKDEHLCLANYQLVVDQPSQGEPRLVDLISTDSDWDRSLSVTLSGFSHDSSRVLGLIIEGGKPGFFEVFEYRPADGVLRTVDVSKQISRALPAHCSATPSIIGTTEDGEIAIELTSANNCAPDNRWLLDAKDQLHKFNKNTIVLTLQ